MTGMPAASGLFHAAATMVFDAETRLENDPRKWARELFARVPNIQPGR